MAVKQSSRAVSVFTDVTIKALSTRLRCKLSPFPSFYGPIIISYGPLFQRRLTIFVSSAIDIHYFGGTQRSLFWWQLAIIILAAISNCYFGNDRWLLFRRWLSIAILAAIGNYWPKASPIQPNKQSKCSPYIILNTLCICEKTDKFWFVANGWLNIKHNARWSALTVQMKLRHESYDRYAGLITWSQNLLIKHNCSMENSLV